MDDAQTLTITPSGPGRPPADEPPPAALRRPEGNEPPAASLRRPEEDEPPAPPAVLPPEPPVSPSSAEPPASPPPSPPPAELPLSELEFIGCKAVPMTWAQFRRYDGRLEVWDAQSETAWMVREPTSPTHENPSHGLAGLVALIAAVRGSPIKCYGSMDLLRRDAHGNPRRIMQADQTVYLRPWLAELLSASAMVVGEHNYPDVVLEVDHTTDVRRGKLKLYEAWGFPELWVEVPEHWVASRPRGLVPGLTIHLLEDGAYRVSPESVAFPGWRAEDIHEAMNEPAPSGRTHGILERLGRRLGAREGTGPDDDALMRSLRSQSRAEGLTEGEKKGRAKGLAEGRRKGRAEGLAEGERIGRMEGLAEGERIGRAEGLAEGERKGRVEARADTLAKLARRMLRSRGVEVSEGFLADPVFAASSEDAVFEAASACADETRFLAALRDGTRPFR